MYIREQDMYPELRAILAERDPALGPREAGTNYIFEFERLRGCWREQVSPGLAKNAQEHAITLWPDGAPGAAGDAPADVPLLYPVFPEASPTSGVGPTIGAAMIVCPGGGWQFHAPWEAFPFAEWFRELGIAAFVLQYRLLPYIMPAYLEDGKRAVRVVRSRAEEFGLDVGRIGVIGFSAGGYVAAALSTMHDPGDPEARDPIERESSRPDASVLFYPVTKTGGSRFLGLLLANDPEPDPAWARRYSPSLQVSQETPPAYLYGLLSDQILAPDHLLDYAAACQRHDVPFELHFYGYGRHGAGVAFADPRLDWQTSLKHWLGERGFLAQ
jgi:acetyl esterase/lipase